jgi:hypothetical protein
MRMQYPDDFVKRCKETYPDFYDLHEALDDGLVFAGRYLDDSRYGGVSNKDILRAESLEQVQELARQCEMRNQLYKEWFDLYQLQKNN